MFIDLYIYDLCFTKNGASGRCQNVNQFMHQYIQLRMYWYLVRWLKLYNRVWYYIAYTTDVTEAEPKVQTHILTPAT